MRVYLVEDGKWDTTLFRMAFLDENKAITYFEKKYRSYDIREENPKCWCLDGGYWAVINKVKVRK